MGNDTLVNDRSPVTKGSDGTTPAFPDPCKTSTPAGPVPIPYPNIAKSGDLANGTTSVKVNGASVAVKGSNLSTSAGDEAGSVGGVMSSKTKGKAEPLMYSFNVKFEGKGVVRNFDPFLNNDKNTPPAPLVQAQVAPIPPAPPEQEEEPERCEYCGKNKHDFAERSGTNLGNGGALGRRIFGDGDKAAHPWNTGAFSLQAHHLVCSEAMDSDTWSRLCREFGYDINRKENGVMLPYLMELACQTAAPLHRSNHQQGRADGLPYPDKIKELIEKVRERAEAGEFCSDPGRLVEALDKIANEVLVEVSAFNYTITKDGEDYAAGKRGCGGVPSLNRTKGPCCPHDRQHGLVQQQTKSTIPKRSGPLKIGT